jgi:CRP-like cAMP-binding protein
MIHTLEPIVREQPFFHGLEDRHIDLIAGCARNVRFDAGSILFHEGDPADHFYLIREGLVAVQTVVPHNGLTTLQTVGGGEVLGWSWLLSPHRWHFDARAQQPTRAIAFDGKCLRAKCDDDHDLGYAIYTRFTRIVAARLEATRLQLLDMYGKRG